MATYAQLALIGGDNVLMDKITVAVAIQAEVVRNEPGATSNHPARLIWMKSAFSDPRAMAAKMMWAVIAQNQANTDTAIRTATDAAILAAVAAAVDAVA